MNDAIMKPGLAGILLLVIVPVARSHRGIADACYCILFSTNFSICLVRAWSGLKLLGYPPPNY